MSDPSREEPLLEDLQEAFHRELTKVAERGTAPLLEQGGVSEDLRDKIRTQTQTSVRKAAQAYAEALHPFLGSYLDSRFSTLSESIQQVLTTQIAAFTSVAVPPGPVGPGTVVTSSTSVTQSVVNTLVTSSTITVTQSTVPSSLVLWRWNKTDVSQFDTTTVITSSFLHSATMNFRASCPEALGPAFVISASWTGTGQGYVAFRLSPSESLFLPSKFVVFFRQSRTNKLGTTETISVGPLYHNGNWTQEGVYGFGATYGDVGIVGIRLEGSGAVATFRPFEEGPSIGGNQNQLIYPGTTEARTAYHEVHVKQPVSASNPPISILNFYNMVGTAGQDEVRQIRYQDALLWNGGEAETAPNPQWYLQRCDQFGLVARRENAPVVGTFTSVFEFSDMIIMKHPTDW